MSSDFAYYCAAMCCWCNLPICDYNMETGKGCSMPKDPGKSELEQAHHNLQQRLLRQNRIHHATMDIRRRRNHKKKRIE